jgi:WD40 repeat protein
MATASEKGTLIRLFLTETGNIIQEIRRGKETALIKDICFDNFNNFIACCSDRGTVHIWSFEDGLKTNKKNDNEKIENAPKNQKSIFSPFPSFLSGGFFKSDWSFANVRIKDTNSICYFGKDNNIFVASTQGNFYKAFIDLKKGGDCEIKEKIKFIK